MAASHFFTGIAAGLAVAGVTVVVMGGALSVPGQIAAWITGPSAFASLAADNAVASRPQHGFVPGDPTPTPLTLPTIGPRAIEPTPVPPAPTAPAVSAAGVLTGKVRAPEGGVRVRRAVAVESASDPILQNGTPIVLSSGSPSSFGGQVWRAIRATGNVAGWLPVSAIQLDGQPDQAPAASAAASPSAVPAGDRGVIVNTDGLGVVARSAPVDSARVPYGFLEGAPVTILERQGTDWIRVRGANGQEGWIPGQYLRTTP